MLFLDQMGILNLIVLQKGQKLTPFLFISALFQIWEAPCSIITYHLWQYQPSVACGELISEYDHLCLFGPEVS